MLKWKQIPPSANIIVNRKLRNRVIGTELTHRFWKLCSYDAKSFFKHYSQVQHCWLFFRTMHSSLSNDNLKIRSSWWDIWNNFAKKNFQILEKLIRWNILSDNSFHIQREDTISGGDDMCALARGAETYENTIIVIFNYSTKHI